MDRIEAAVLALLFDLTQQAARFGAGTNPWAQLAAYDVDDFALFARNEESRKGPGHSQRARAHRQAPSMTT
ncbi:hypothetical protein ACFYW8_10875 [Streptomyces sp. NPDC002742]|uniref:hypothetical protein n=1 Tax=Streptomyces sp. NPDC002742 TaxID=3364663 RepID=UPI003688BA78